MEEENTKQNKVILEEKHTELVRIIESFENLEKSKEWATLKELVFDRSLEAIKRQLIMETLNPVINSNKLYKLQGEYAWALQYSDTNRFIENLKKQLENINKQIK